MRDQVSGWLVQKELRRRSHGNLLAADMCVDPVILVSRMMFLSTCRGTNSYGALGVDGRSDSLLEMRFSPTYRFFC